ncbi:MAG: heavy metal-binding domain-containing protein [Bacteroidales bacterium]|jgi:flagellar basal body-associated protein FliL|nr:heavy metal-binding domain-containing protein [Bacteroidales bacterium]
MRKVLFIFALVVIFTAKSVAVFSQDSQEQKKIIYTTLDVKQNYEIIQIILAQSDITSTFSGSPVVKAYTSAWDQFKKNAESNGADAVVGVRFELENMNAQIVGRLLIYGTAVKFVE